MSMAKGDHLYVDRGLGLYTHHGIDCGDGTVIHYLEGDAIARTSKAFFAGGEPIFIRSYAQCDSPDRVVQRAESRLGEREYNVAFNNCEHFVTWCKTGRHESEQVNQAIAASAVGGIMGGVLLGGAFAAPALAAAGAYGLHKLVEQARETQDPKQAEAYLQQAFGELRIASHELESQLESVLRKAYEWDCTARLALQRQRDDLARAALLKKYPLKQKALALQGQLNQVNALADQIQQKFVLT